MQELFALLTMIFTVLLFAFVLAITIRMYQALTIYVIKNSEYYYSPYAFFLNKVKMKRSEEATQENNIRDDEK